MQGDQSGHLKKEKLKVQTSHRSSADAGTGEKMCEICTSKRGTSHCFEKKLLKKIKLTF